MPKICKLITIIAVLILTACSDSVDHEGIRNAEQLRLEYAQSYLAHCTPNEIESIPTSDRTELSGPITNWLSQEAMQTLVRTTRCYKSEYTSGVVPTAESAISDLRFMQMMVINALMQHHRVPADMSSSNPFYRLRHISFVRTVRERARNYLKDPEKLQTSYRILRPVLVTVIRRSSEADGIRARLNALRQMFALDPADEVVQASLIESDLCDASHNAWMNAENAYESRVSRAVRAGADEDEYRYALHPWRPTENLLAMQNACDRANSELLRLEPNAIAIQWLLRRRNEGGEPLVQAWRQIFADLSLSISDGGQYSQR